MRITVRIGFLYIGEVDDRFCGIVVCIAQYTAVPSVICVCLFECFSANPRDALRPCRCGRESQDRLNGNERNRDDSKRRGHHGNFSLRKAMLIASAPSFGRNVYQTHKPSAAASTDGAMAKPLPDPISWNESLGSDSAR